jgi:hypothetical protein
VRVQEHDRDALDAVAGEGRRRFDHAGAIERFTDRAVGEDALADAQPERPRHERLRGPEQVVPHVLTVLVDPQ